MCKKINKKMKSYENREESFKSSVKKAECNARIYAERTPGDSEQFGVYMDYAGRSRLLVTRDADILFGVLEPGLTLGELRRWKPGRGRLEGKLGGMISHLVDVADCELEQIIEGEPDWLTIEIYSNRRSDRSFTVVSSGTLPHAA